MGTILTSEEYKELNELRRYKAKRESDDKNLSDAVKQIGQCTDEIRKMVAERKRCNMPDGGVR